MKLLTLFLFYSTVSFGLNLPKGLSVSDQEDVVKVLGFGTTVKMASNPYPLGGYSGFEFAVDINFINIDPLTRIGCDPGSPGCANTSHSDVQEFSYGKLTIGKGIYQNVDIFLSFAPFIRDGSYSDFGGMLRWTFFEAKLLPIHFTAVLTNNQVNFGNEFVARNFSGDLIVGINIEDISVYFGGGHIRSEGSFIGGVTGDGTVDPGTPGLDPDTNTSKQVLYRFHTVLGASYEFKPLFVAGEINRYEDSVYTVKVGLRF